MQKILKNLNSLEKIAKPFQFQQKKKLQELVKMEKKLQKPYPTDYNLLIVQNLWQVRYKILLIILLKEYVKINVNIDTIIIISIVRD